jgi:uncharacterized protein (TIGR03435 family)
MVKIVCVVGGITGRPSAQTPSAPAFEVASIKPNTSGDPRSGTHNLPGGRVTITNQLLRDVIRTAYGSNDMEIIGGPDWMVVDRWDVVAAAAPGNPDAPWQLMLKSLLTERFKLRAHLESRERPIYRLVVARRDNRLGPEVHDTSCRIDAVDCSRTSANTKGITSGTITSAGQTMADLGTSLSPYVERRVFDHTGLDGRYDFQLRWSEDLSIFTALQDQLGLKLESTKGPVDVLVIDHAEKPAED